MTTRRFPKRPSLETMVERVDQRRPGDVPGDTVPTGFPSIDRILGGGLRRRDLVVLGGDIGSGKSALALGLALRTAQQGTGVALFSGEMDEERLMERALAIEGRATVDELRSAKLNDQTRAGIGGAAVRLRDLPLTILPLAAGRRSGPRVAAPQGAGARAAGGARRRVAAAAVRRQAPEREARARRFRASGRDQAACRRGARALPGGDVQPGTRRGRGDRADRPEEPQRADRLRRSVLLPALDAVRRHARP